MNARCRTAPRRLLLLTALAAISACSQHPRGPQRPATIQPIGNAQLMGDVIALLEKGDEKAARKALKRMVKRHPNDAGAKRLLESLTADPVTLLGAKSFDYRVQPGDRLMALAQRFLGDHLKFYALARYNGIKVPASLQSGQTIRIPGIAPPRPAPVPRPVRPAPPRPDPIAPAPVRPAPPVPSPPALPRVPAPAVDPARAAQLRAAGLAALNRGQVARAVALLGQAAALDPGNTLIRRDLERARRIRQTVKDKR